MSNRTYTIEKKKNNIFLIFGVLIFLVFLSFVFKSNFFHLLVILFLFTLFWIFKVSFKVIVSMFFIILAFSVLILSLTKDPIFANNISLFSYYVLVSAMLYTFILALKSQRGVSHD